MTQKWSVYPDIRNDQEQPLMWPDNFIPIPKSLEVAFLVARYHQDTGNDIDWDGVAEIASHVAQSHYDAIGTAPDETTKGLHLAKALEAQEILVEKARAHERHRMHMMETLQVMLRRGPEF